MRRQFVLILCVITILSILLSACGGGTTATTAVEPPAGQTEPTQPPAAEPTTPPAEPPAAEPTTPPAAEPSGDGASFAIWTMPNGADPQGYIDTEIAEFIATHPDVTITAEIVGWGDAYSRIQTAVQGGEGPCITQMGTTWVPTFGAMGGVLSYTDDVIDAVGGEPGFVPASWETGLMDGQVFAMPWFADIRAITYRKDILEQAGLTEDIFKDVDSFRAGLKAIKDAGLTDDAGNEIVPFIHTGRNDWNVWQNASMWMWAFGGELLNEDATEAVFNSEEAVDGVEFYYTFFGEELTSEDTLELNSAQTDGRFGEGYTFAFMSGPWLISLARDWENQAWTQAAAENMAFAQIPAGPGGQYTFIGGSNLAIMNSCQYKEEAVEFVKFLLSKESQIRYANNIGMLPVTLEAQNDPVFTADPQFSVFIEAAQNGKTATNIVEWGQLENTLQTALASLWEDVAASGYGTPIERPIIQERLDEAVDTVNSLLNQ